MASQARAQVLQRRIVPVLRIPRPQWSQPAWGAIAVTAAFIGVTLWWLAEDSSIPIFDAGLHLSFVVAVHQLLAEGRLLDALTRTIPYPPFAYLVGSLGILVGGVGVMPVILAENVVFVSLLALGCYRLGRLAFGPRAGLLAVVFALGSPLITAQFHVFMIDAPETAMVAVSAWLIVATEGFTRLKGSALAGLACGLGMLTKEPFAVFVAGIVIVTIVRGGRSSWRGFALFAAVALVIALPWYIHEYSQIQTIGGEATSSSTSLARYAGGVAPPRFSAANLEWYFWSILNVQLYLPLFVLAAAGWVTALVGFARRRPVSPLALELTVGAFVAWVAITETFLHDNRYGMPLLVYLAVFGAGWIVRLPRRGRAVATAVLVLAALANTLGTSFGVGTSARISLPGWNPATALEQSGRITLFANSGFLVTGPHRDGDLLAMLQAMRRDGVREASGFRDNQLSPDFSKAGVVALTLIAGLKIGAHVRTNAELSDRDAVLGHAAIGAQGAPPCVTLDDGTGVWVILGNPFAPGARYYCPLPHPHFYAR